MSPAALYLFGVVVGMAFLGMCLAWDHRPAPRPPKPRRESMSERNHRIHAEFRARTQPDYDANAAARWHS